MPDHYGDDPRDVDDIPATGTCDRCGGSGEIGWFKSTKRPCPSCGGSGEVSGYVTRRGQGKFVPD